MIDLGPGEILVDGCITKVPSGGDKAGAPRSAGASGD